MDFDDEAFSMTISCVHEANEGDGNNVIHPCESTNFTNLVYNQCDINLTFIYDFQNRAESSVRLRRLIDDKFNDVIDQSQLIEGNSEVSIQRSETFNICSSRYGHKSVVAIIELVQGSEVMALPPSKGEINFQTPYVYILKNSAMNDEHSFFKLFCFHFSRSVPFLLELESVDCQVDDGIGISCETFLGGGVTGNQQCVIDVKFNYHFTNTGLGCHDIVSIRSELGPVGKQVINFADVYNYNQRQLCANEQWIIPDKRASVNLCNIEGSSWQLAIEVKENFGIVSNLTMEYSWRSVASPSASPTVDTCQSCTLTGVVSAGTYSCIDSFF